MGLRLIYWTWLVLCVGAAAAQIAPERRFTPIELSIRVSYSNNEVAPLQTRVQLLNSTGNVITEGFSDSRGEVRFPSVGPGVYRLRITHPDLEETRTDAFQLFPNQGSAVQWVTVTGKGDADKQQKNSTEGYVSAFMLSIPRPAQKEFDEGVKLYGKKKFDLARVRFEKAKDLYPHYAAAYEYLGVMDAESGDMPNAEAHFQESLSADPGFIPAYYHLAKTCIQKRDMQKSEELLQKALKLDPRSAEGLFLLVYVQISANHFDDVIATTARLHQLPHEKFAAAHIAAGNAYANKNMRAQSKAEYEMYLKESPTGPSAQVARNAITSLAEAPKN